MIDTAFPPDARFEFKFALPRAMEIDVQRWLAFKKLDVREVYPPRYVNNIYFDSFDFKNLQDNLAGISSRCKVRLRWYGGPRIPEKVALELKFKRNLLGWKKTCDLDMTTYSDDKNIAMLVRDQAPSDFLPILDENSMPSLFNRYLRSYYESLSGVRITLDKNLMLAAVCEYRISSDMQNMLSAYEEIIVEIKAPSNKKEEINELLKDFPFSLDKSSKYVKGVLAAQAHI